MTKQLARFLKKEQKKVNDLDEKMIQAKVLNFIMNKTEFGEGNIIQSASSDSRKLSSQLNSSLRQSQGTSSGNISVEKRGEMINQVINQEYSKELLEKQFIEEFTMYPDFFSATFFAMRKSYKKKYKLLESDQVSYYFESLFIIAAQVVLCVCLLQSMELMPIQSYQFGVNLSTLITSLALHFGCIPAI